jgi:hypothetical protein
MALYSEYVDYFKYLCTQHPDIQHQDALHQDAFAIIDIEDLGEFRTKIKTKDIVFRLINYMNKLGQNTTGQEYKELQGGFLIIDFFSPRKDGSAGLQAALDRAETVVDQFIERMILDSRNGHSLFHHSLDSAQNFTVETAIGRHSDGAYAGWLVLFDFQYHFPVCADNRAGWLDGSVTPPPSVPADDAEAISDDDGILLSDDDGEVLTGST